MIITANGSAGLGTGAAVGGSGVEVGVGNGTAVAVGGSLVVMVGTAVATTVRLEVVVTGPEVALSLQAARVVMSNKIDQPLIL